MKLQFILLFLALLTTGLMSGIFFTWTNAVTPGIGKLHDLAYLNALQSMNRVILNIPFYIVFTIPVISLTLVTFFFYSSNPPLAFKLILIATLIYLLGAFLVTISGNIPLNNLLDQTNLTSLNLEEAKQLRDQIELKWNYFNLIRTVSAAISFGLLLLAAFLLETPILKL
ncbi:anthrone oxygenase family protein [Aureispira anguillae]|uniref:DUF1772 domain-containing protein n=1 Tax=Aureispira anguillae TaxID=2864201 RepID=A0A915YFL4_9BACT|nr:DUF1772 domain-containing protein [Aureispira anguillae]BDS12124.1 DUF1772 domain-containing protein [Aureispira anguillae]